MDHIGTAAVMLIVHPGRIDLLFQDIDLAFQLLLQEIGLIELVFRRLDLQIDLLHLFLDGLVFRLHLIIAAAGITQFLIRCRILFFQIRDLLPQTFLLKKEHINIISLKFFFFLQILFRNLRLLFQRSQLLFQLFQDIVHTGQVHPLFFKLAHREILPALELNDPGRLVKKLAPFLRLAAEDPVDLSLSDDRISFFTDTGIIEHFINIFQTARRPVDQIFAFPGAVQLAGHRHFFKINRELMVRIIQRNGHRRIT